MKLNKVILEDVFDNATICMTPELPKLEVKKDKIKYKITDLRYLNETAVEVFRMIMEIVMNTKNCEEVSFDITNIKKDTWRIIVDIVCSIEYEYSKGGKNGFRGSGRILISGASYTKKDNIAIGTFYLFKNHVKYLYDYAKDRETVNDIDAIIHIANRQMQSYNAG